MKKEKAIELCNRQINMIYDISRTKSPNGEMDLAQIATVHSFEYAKALIEEIEIETVQIIKTVEAPDTDEVINSGWEVVEEEQPEETKTSKNSKKVTNA